MKRLFVCLGILLAHLSFAQTIGLRSASIEQEEVKLPAYDTTTMYMEFKYLLDNPKYYDNQKILFLPYVNSSKRPYNYYSGFYTKESIEVPSLADTIWIRKRKNVKEGDYKVEIPKTNVYCAEYVKGAIVRNIDVLRTLTEETGFFTPYQAIEGKEFVVRSASVEKRNYADHYISMELIADTGEIVYYNHLHGIREYSPIMMLSFVNQYSSQLIGNKYHVGDEVVDKRILMAKEFGTEKYRILDTDVVCTELTLVKAEKPDFGATDFVGVDMYDLTNPKPFLFFKDEKGREYGFEIEENLSKYDFYSSVYSSQFADGENYEYTKSYYEFKLKDLIPADEYHQRVEERRIQEENRLAEEKRAEQERKKAAELAERKRIEEQQRAKAEREARIRSTYKKEFADLILAGRVRIGMTASMCREAWGTPIDINRTTGSWGVHEQWVYYDSYLYFENGILTTIQD